MKKIMTVIISTAMILSLVGCGDSKNTETTEDVVMEATTESIGDEYEYTTYDIDDYASVDIPSDWEYSKDDSGTFFYPPDDGSVVIHILDCQQNYNDTLQLIESGSMTKDQASKLYIEPFLRSLLEDADGTQLLSYTPSDMLDYPCEYFTATREVNDNLYDVIGYSALFPSGIYIYFLYTGDGCEYDYSSDLEEIVCNTTLYDNSDQVDDSYEEDTEIEEETTDPQEDSATIGEYNALSKARDYLDYTAFSHDGLIGQLKYEGFSEEDATYAADNCGVDWKEQAKNKAIDYLDYTAFSYDGLVKQLEYEKFTEKQAKYGADNCGADWNEQAAKKAQEYMDYSSFSESELINQLEYEGFTSEQAEYGVKAVGY